MPSSDFQLLPDEVEAVTPLLGFTVLGLGCSVSGMKTMRVFVSVLTSFPVKSRNMPK